MKIIVCVLCTMSVFLNKANITHFQQELLSEGPQEPHVYIYIYLVYIDIYIYTHTKCRYVVYIYVVLLSIYILSVDITHSHSDLVGKLLAVWLFNFSIFQKP